MNDLTKINQTILAVSSFFDWFANAVYPIQQYAIVEPLGDGIKSSISAQVSKILALEQESTDTIQLMGNQNNFLTATLTTSLDKFRQALDDINSLLRIYCTLPSNAQFKPAAATQIQ